MLWFRRGSENRIWNRIYASWRSHHRNCDDLEEKVRIVSKVELGLIKIECNVGEGGVTRKADWRKEPIFIDLFYIIISSSLYMVISSSFPVVWRSNGRKGYNVIEDMSISSLFTAVWKFTLRKWCNWNICVREWYSWFLINYSSEKKRKIFQSSWKKNHFNVNLCFTLFI